MNRKIPVWLLALVIFLGLNITILFGEFIRYLEKHGRRQEYGKLGEVAKVISEFPSLAKKAFVEVFVRGPLNVENRFPDIDGFRKKGILQKGALKDGGYLLLSAYDKDMKQSTVKLIRISDQKVMHKWMPNIQKLKQAVKKSSFQMDNMTSSRYRMRHPLLLNDGGIIFAGHDTPLFKIDACSKFEWLVNDQFHHSIESDGDGNLWVPSVMNSYSYGESILYSYRNDAIAKISPQGEVLLKRSVSKILEKNGYLGLVFGVGKYEENPIYLNDIQPAHYSSKYWEKGDLLLSLRNISTVLIYRPSTDKIIWLKTGPWLVQHDADFIGESKISVFGNDALRDKMNVFFKHNDIYVFDFAGESISTPYSEVLKNNDVRTPTEGLQEILENGDAFIEETDYGRLIRVSSTGVVWEFTAKIDDDTTGLMHWSRYLTSEQIGNIFPILEKSNCP